MSSSVLATRLNELSAARLVEGGYRLTRLGEELVEAMGPMVEWSRRWPTNCPDRERFPLLRKPFRVWGERPVRLVHRDERSVHPASTVP
ncbi:hypothetical protein [Saccharopolyspora shandongensis]|uniref:hypothetical protein n=1 Tax=Saccharopolyspora shandongensis TaxID=418495 RepID=UPI0033FC966C